MSKNLLSSLKLPKFSFSIIVDSSTNVSKEDFEKTKVCLNGLIENISCDSHIMVINYSKTSEIISEFELNKKTIIENVKKNLKYMGYKNSNLSEALKLSLSRINTTNKELTYIVVVITNGIPSDSPNQTVCDMMARGIKFLTIGIGKVDLSKLEKLFIGQNNMIFDKYDDLISKIEQFSPSKIDIPITYAIFPKNDKTQKSSEDLLLTIKVSPKDNIENFDIGKIEIIILENNYYYGYREIINDIECNATLKLRVKPNCEIFDLPETIDFKIKIQNEVYSLYFSLDTAWFAEDLETPYKINIFVDGIMGAGKSSFLNILLNLFTSQKNIDHVFFTSKNNQEHGTKGIQYISLSRYFQLKLKNEFLPIYQDIMNKIKITLVDKVGMFGSLNIIDYKSATKGCYKHNSEMIEIGPPLIENECHSIIFIVSMNNIGKNSDYDFIKSRISDFLKTNIQPILVITFSDLFSEEEQKILKKDLYELPVEKENIYFLVPYINNETKRDPSKDLIAWKIMKRAVEISKQTMLKKMYSMSDEEISKLYNNLYINSNSPQSIYTIPSHQRSYEVPSPNPDIASHNAPEKQENLLIISVTNGSKTLKIKVKSKTIVKDFYSTVAKLFSINSDFILEDSGGCVIFGDEPIDEYLFKKECELYIKF